MTEAQGESPPSLRAPAPDRKALFTVLLDTRQTRLLRTAVLLTGSVAAGEDVLQTALSRVWAAAPDLPDVDALEAYVRKTLTNTTTNLWRSRMRERAFHALHRAPGALSRSTGDDPAGQIALREDLLRALRALPPRARAVVVLRYYLDLSEEETARQLGISVGTVKSQASRSLRAVRATLAADAGGRADR